MKYLIDLSNDTFSGPVFQDISVDSSQSLYDLMSSMSKNAWIETDLLPVSGAGMLSYRAAFGSEQIIYQIPPGVYTVRWGDTENDMYAENYQLAHPWKVVIADFKDGNFLGVRHFYSPDSIVYWDQPLYAVNLPNTNTRGYNGTSIGWVCLYLKDDTQKYSLAEKVDYIIHRESGLSEPYNNNNMNNTDGTRFYERNGAPVFMYNPSEWQLKTQKEGYSWILDSNLLIDLHVSTDGHAERYDQESPVYTLRRASFEPYSAYYSDNLYDKPFNILSRQGFDPAHRNTWLSPIMSITGNTLLDSPKEKLSPSQVLSKNYDFIFSDNITNSTKSGWICYLCDEKYPFSDENTSVVTSYSFNPVLKSLHSFNHETFCSSCVDNDVIYIDSEYDYFTFGCLVWCDTENEWAIPEKTISCSNCYSIYTSSHTVNNGPVLVYSDLYPDSIETSPIVGCIGCIDSESFVVSDINNNLLLYSKAVSYKKASITMEYSDIILEDGTKAQQFKPVLVTNEFYTSAYKAQASGNVICKCEFMVPESSLSNTVPSTCTTCLVKGEYKCYLDSFSSDSLPTQKANAV
jgi:hypothetical protein